MVAKALKSASGDAGADLYEAVQALENALSERSLVKRLEAAEHALGPAINSSNGLLPRRGKTSVRDQGRLRTARSMQDASRARRAPAGLRRAS